MKIGRVAFQQLKIVLKTILLTLSILLVLAGTANKETQQEYIINHIGDYALLSVQNASQYHKVIDQLKDDEQVLEAQGNVAISTLSFSNDTYAGTQWAIENKGHYLYINESGKQDKEAVENIDMDVVEAWDAFSDLGLAKREVVVAVIDTGVDYTHPELVDHMWVNKNEIDGDNIDNDNNGYIDDIYGWDFYNNDATVCHYEYSEKYKKNVASSEDNDDHGTHVAGIIAATANNKIGIAGVASKIDVKIMSLKINGRYDGTGNISSAIEAIKYATAMGADICNLSWGTSIYTEALEQVMRESDMLFVAAAGNDGSNNNIDPVYPASLPLDNVISVTFIDSDGELTRFSNYGDDSVDIAAPGEDIYSTIVGSYAPLSGSSMAAPQVSAVAAILYACNDHLYPVNVKQILMGTMKKLPDLDGRIINPGIPSAYKAIMAADNLAQDQKAPTMTFDTIYSKENMIVPVYVDDQGNSGVRVIKWSMGKKNLEYFERGMKGTTVKENQIKISKAGTYTFYAADYAGNEVVQTYKVLDDVTAPKLTLTYTVANNYKSRTITVRTSELQSGVKRIEYMAGIKSAKDFLPAEAGTVVQLEDGKGTFKVKKDGNYTIFATDNRGNLAVKYIVIRTVKATAVLLPIAQKTMLVGEQFTLRTTTKPMGTTDRLTFTSSDETVATVSSSGKITVLKVGKTKITVKTSSGLTQACTITVEP